MTVLKWDKDKSYNLQLNSGAKNISWQLFIKVRSYLESLHEVIGSMNPNDAFPIHIFDGKYL